MVATITAGTSARYYLSLTSYYTGSGEPSGYWIKVSVAAGFAAGEIVKDADFEKLHAGLDEYGRPLLASSSVKALRVGGYDLSLSASKTVSMRWATDKALRGDIERAHATAVEAALALAEREAAFCRFGKDGKRREKTRLTAAAFLHGEARPAAHSDGAVFADPDLHTHIVIMNIGPKSEIRDIKQSIKVQYGALDGRVLFNWKMAIGACYHLTLATELQKLGLSIASVGKNGVFEIAGVDRQLIEYFSARRNSIKAELEKAGRDSSEAPALAAAITLATRDAKRDHGDEDRFENWRKRIRALGFDPEQMRAQTLNASAAAAMGSLDELEKETLIKAKVDAIPRLLTERESTFERRTLYASIAATLVGTGASSDRVDQEIDRLTELGEVVALDRDEWGHPVLTTQEMLTIEREIGELALRLGGRRNGGPVEQDVDRFVADKHLSAEQMAAIRAATGGAGIVVIEGAPGSGKSTTLKPICRTWQAAGYRVIGGATAWKVANALREDLGVEARAIDSWLARAAAGRLFFDDKTVLVIDEARAGFGNLDSRLSGFSA